MNGATDHGSPRWNWTTKLVVALTFVAIVAWFVLRFQGIIGPILTAFVLAYLFYPIARYLNRALRLPWRLGVTIIYLLLYILFLGLLTLGGLALIDQAQAFINFINSSLTNLPNTLAQLTTQVYKFGPFEFSLANLDLATFTNQILSAIQPLFGRLTGLLGLLASSAANLVGWTFLVLLLSYFILAETGGAAGRLINIRIPGYEQDIHRLGEELGRIWNAFLRGQIIIFGITIVLYTIVLGLLKVHYYPGLAVLAGLAKFVPYVGPFIAWTTYGLVAYFQGGTVFHLAPLAYALVVVGVALVLDNMFDNFVSPRIMAQALKVHPAAVLVAAIVSISVLGLVGVVLAAPVVATFKLFGTYGLRKMFDQDPWEGIVTETRPQLVPTARRLRAIWRIIQTWAVKLWARITAVAAYLAEKRKALSKKSVDVHDKGD